MQSKYQKTRYIPDPVQSKFRPALISGVR